MKDKFSDQAPCYAQFRPDYPPSVFEAILSRVEQKRTAWDCATGSGQAAKVLSQSFQKVYATDISAKQIDHATPANNIFYSVQPAEKTTFAAASFDLITVAQAIHWFDWEAFYDEVRRVAKPDAVIAVWGYSMPEFLDDPSVNDLLQDFYHTETHPYWDAERRHIDNHYASIPFPFDDVEKSSFTIRLGWQKKNLEGYLNSWSAIQNCIKINGYNPVDDFMKKILPIWQSDEAEKTIYFPVFLMTGIVKAG